MKAPKTMKPSGEGFHEEFMEHWDEFSDSWRDAALKQQRF